MYLEQKKKSNKTNKQTKKQQQQNPKTIQFTNISYYHNVLFSLLKKADFFGTFCKFILKLT